MREAMGQVWLKVLILRLTSSFPFCFPNFVFSWMIATILPAKRDNIFSKFFAKRAGSK